MSLLCTAETVAAEVARRMALNTVAQGAETDIGVSVFRGKRSLEERMFPCSVLIEGADTPKDQQPTSGGVRISQRYVLQSMLTCDPNHPNDMAHAAIRDLKRCIFLTNGKPNSRFGDKVQNVEYVGREIGARVDGAGFVIVAIEISVYYAENLGAP